MVSRWRLNLDHKNKAWIEEIKSRLAHRPTDNNTSVVFHPAKFGDLVSACREIVGDLELHQVRGVYLPYGNEVLPHSHLSMRVLLYMPHDHPSLLEFQYPYESTLTEEGYVVDVPRGRSHSVSINKGDPRCTIAVMYRQDWDDI